MDAEPSLASAAWTPPFALRRARFGDQPTGLGARNLESPLEESTRRLRQAGITVRVPTLCRLPERVHLDAS